ncbi:hypothetical protein OBBRIDRAFT_284075 [Obba rivulosa]|uniref:Zn(2)-C6 fungal-type domain-containing protein n=1 Tax=Obba rivulosa TaxID=1052685 RepID=A0A8E2APK7_9APHY|nr:hypothetical protein OBBRIDRAFT_284075 [Obba rivulosa]
MTTFNGQFVVPSQMNAPYSQYTDDILVSMSNRAHPCTAEAPCILCHPATWDYWRRTAPFLQLTEPPSPDEGNTASSDPHDSRDGGDVVDSGPGCYDQTIQYTGTETITIIDALDAELGRILEATTAQIYAMTQEPLFVPSPHNVAGNVIPDFQSYAHPETQPSLMGTGMNSGPMDTSDGSESRTHSGSNESYPSNDTLLLNGAGPSRRTTKGKSVAKASKPWTPSKRIPSGKACDTCRRLKIKCKRNTPGEPCK